MRLLECVPNFSEGRNPQIIEQIAQSIRQVEGVRLLDVDPGKATNRTVMTFVGEPEAVEEAAFQAIATASRLIRMDLHKGEHPRMGATDVCPFIPISGVSMEEAVEVSRRLGKRIGEELGIPVYLYEKAASAPYRRNLADIRAGEYEGLAEKLKDPRWQPDFGPADLSVGAGATVIGARNFLVAYNVNLNTQSVRRANSVAFDVRERGRVLRKGDPLTGEIVKDENGQPVYQPGKLKSVKAIGWFIEEYGIAQISMNLTDLSICKLHEAFDAVCESAASRGLRVTGSELVGLIPKSALIEAGKHFLKKQNRSRGVSESELIHIAVKSLGLDELKPFDPKKKVIEYLIEDETSSPLVRMNLTEFADQTASESPAPGGGSISAYAGALGASLAGMVANLSANKRGWDHLVDEFSTTAERAQEIKSELLKLVDSDTQAFNLIMEAFRLPKNTEAEKAERQKRIREATIHAMETPYRVMELSAEVLQLAEHMAQTGLKSSISDAGVAVHCALAAVHGAHLNVRINAGGLKPDDPSLEMLNRAEEIAGHAASEAQRILGYIDNWLKGQKE